MGNEGAVAGGFSDMPAGAIGLGWQRDRSAPNVACRVEKSRRNGYGCFNSQPQVWGTYAGLSWAAAAKRDLEVTCESTQQADTITLANGTEFDLGGMSDGESQELWALAGQGDELNGLPGKFARFRK